MAGDYRDYLMKNLPIMQQQPPRPPVTFPNAGGSGLVANPLHGRPFYPVARPVTREEAAAAMRQRPSAPPGINYAAGGSSVVANDILGQLLVRPVTPEQAAAGYVRGPMPPPGIDYGADGRTGGGGVTANDILGQLGPVVIDPQIPQSVIDTLPGSADNVPEPVVKSSESPELVPQSQDIKFFEENTQLPTGTMPMTPEEKIAKEVEDAKKLNEYVTNSINVAGSQENVAYWKAVDAGMTPEDAIGEVIRGFSAEKIKNILLTGALDLIDKPRQLVVEEMGANAYDVATGKSQSWSAGPAAIAPGNWMLAIPWTDYGLDATRFNQDFATWANDPRNWQAIRNASENGFQATETDPMFTGGRAVWELFINGAGGMYKFLSDILNDPTVLAPASKALGDPLVESAIRTLPDGSIDRSLAKYAAGSVLGLPQRVMDATVDAPFNAAGKLLGSIRDTRVGKLLQETPEARATEGVNQTWQATEQQDRIRQEMGDMTPPGDGLDPEPPIRPDLPPEGPRYTRERDGNLWRIKDPQGKTVATMKWEQQVGLEDSFPNREAARVVNEYNAPIIRKEYEEMGAVLPNEGELTWTDPAYLRRTKRGNNVPAPIQERVAFDNTLDPDARRTWMEKWTPAAKEHESVMAEFDGENEKALRAAGLSPEQVIVQRQQPMNSPAATFEQVRFYVEDGLLPFNQLFPGQTQRPREWITTTNPKRDASGIITADNGVNTLIEHAVLGTRDDAIRARAILHQRGVRVDGFKDTGAFVDRLAQMGEAINGPGWRSQKGEAARKRAMRSGQQPITEAGVFDATNVKPTTPRQVKREQPELSYIETIAEAKRINASPVESVAEPLPEPEGISADSIRLLPLDQPDEAIADAISDPATTSITPGKNRVEPTPEGQVRVRPAGAIRQKSVKIERAKRGYTVAVGETDRPITIAEGKPVPGFTRVYRGEAVPGSFVDNRPDWVKAGQRNRGVESAKGRWFTENRALAERYIVDNSESWGVPGRLVYVDIPTSDIDRFRIKNIDPFPALDESGKPIINSETGEPVMLNPRSQAVQDPDTLHDELFLPVDLAAMRQEVPRTLQQAIEVADEVISREAKGIEPTPAEVKRAVNDVSSGRMNLADRVLSQFREASIDQIDVDVSKFQNRKADFSPQTLERLKTSFNHNKFAPIEVTQSADGRYIVTSGHSRFASVKFLAERGDIDAAHIPIRVVEGTDQEIEELAQISNALGTVNTPSEKGRILRSLEEKHGWEYATREVNVNSADGKRLKFLTNLSNGLQDDVDAGRLSIRQGGLLGEYVEKGTITSLEADDLFMTKISVDGITDAELKKYLQAYEIVKPLMMTDMFGEYSLMSTSVDAMKELLSAQTKLTNQQKLLSKAGKLVDAETQTGINRTITQLQTEVDAILKKISGNAYAINPRVQRNIAMGERARRGILADANALQSPNREGGQWWLSKGDNSYVGAAHTIGKLDDETYQTLNTMVMWEKQPMRLWEAYDHALINFEDPMVAKKVISNLVIDPETAMALAAKKEARDNARGLKRGAYKALSAYQTALRFLREAIMFNWARGFSSAFADSTGNAYTLMIHGETGAMMMAFDPRSAKIFIDSERGKQLAIDNLPYMDRFKVLTGGEPPPAVVQLVETRFETGGGPLVLESLGKGYNAFRVFADKDIKAFRTGMDRNFRYALFMSNFNGNIKQAQTRFRGIVAERAQRTGNDYVDWLAKLDGLGNDYTPDDILRTFNDERLARDLRALITDSKVQARKRVDELLFSYKYTNADDALRNVVFFHYWMSRALPMHAKVTFKNPWLLNAYARAWDHMEREAEQNGYPPNVRGFIQMQKSQSGFYSLLNPMQVLVPFGMLMDSNDDPGTMAFLKRWGLFINPIIEAAAASLGWTRTVPDLTGTSAVRRAMRYTVNFMNSNGLDRLVPDGLGDPNTWQTSLVDEAQFRIIEKINGYAQRAEQALTGANRFVDQYEGASKNAYELDQLNSILITELEKEYGPYDTWEPGSPAFDDYLDAKTAIEMGATGNDLADHAVEVMADAKFDATWQGAVIPGGIYQRYGPRDETLAESRAGDQAAKDQREIATGTTGSAKLDILQNEYMGIGTERQKHFSDVYQQIVSDEPIEGYDNGSAIQIGGQYYTKSQMLELTEDERFDLANAWVTQHGGDEELQAFRDERDAFVQKHPEFGDFKTYQGIAYDYQGGLSQFRIDRAAGNPNFKKAMNDQRDYLLNIVGIDPKLIEKELDAWAPTIAAYKAANGIQDSLYDTPPVSTGDQPTINTLVNMGMLNGSKNEGGGSYTGKKSTATTLTKQIKEYEADLKLVEGLLQQYGVDPSILTSNNPYAASSVQSLVGDLMPSEPKLLRQYREWVALQPPGVDTSPEAFAAVIDAIAQDEAA